MHFKNNYNSYGRVRGRAEKSVLCRRYGWHTSMLVLFRSASGKNWTDFVQGADLKLGVANKHVCPAKVHEKTGCGGTSIFESAGIKFCPIPQKNEGTEGLWKLNLLCLKIVKLYEKLILAKVRKNRVGRGGHIKKSEPKFLPRPAKQCRKNGFFPQARSILPPLPKSLSAL